MRVNGSTNYTHGDFMIMTGRGGANDIPAEYARLSLNSALTAETHEDVDPQLGMIVAAPVGVPDPGRE
jgi:hypothetical protein